MLPTTGTSDWAATVEAIVRRAPESAAQPRDLRAQVRLLALLNSAAPLNTLLAGLATYVETWATGLQCAMLLVDPTGQFLLPGAAPSLPVAFTHATARVPIAEGQGSCGTAAARRELVVVDDIEQSALWRQYAPIILPFGLKACWSMPVLDDSRALLGTLALYYRERRAPSTAEVELIQFASSLAAIVIQRHRDSESSRTSEARLEAAVWGTNIGLWECATTGEFRWFNDWCDRCDIDPCSGPGGYERWKALIHPDDFDAYVIDNPPHWYDTANNYATEYRVRDRNGAWRWIHERGKVTVRDSDGTPQLVSGVCIDVDARRQMESALRASLREKEVLLQEVHHRVKNNLQIISSLMNMQLRRPQSASAKETLEQCQRRVQAIALIHEKLYQAKNLANVPLPDYIGSLARDIFQSARVSHADVLLEVRVDDFALPIDTAIPCGLILNELIGNALKHGFVGDRRGTLQIDLKRLEAGQLRLTVTDDGVGLPAEFDIKACRSMGLQLVRTLAEQLGAQLEIGSRAGASFQLTCPCSR